MYGPFIVYKVPQPPMILDLHKLLLCVFIKVKEASVYKYKSMIY